MLTLVCVVVGEGMPFSVKIEENENVGILKNMIRGQKQYTMFPADALELYLAKTGGAWLDTDGAKAVALDEDGKVPGFDVMDPTSALKNPKCIGDDFERKDGDIHVLVVVPDGAGAKTVTPEMMIFVEKMFTEIFVKVVPSTAPSKRKSFKTSLLNYYGYNDPTYQRRRNYGIWRKKSAIRCMLTDQFFPESIVIASHLFRHGWKSYSKEAMDLDDIDDPKNGLLLFKPLEKAFNEYRISFLYNMSSKKYELKVVDTSWKDKTLISQLDTTQLNELRNYGEKTRFHFQTTFGSLEGFPLILRPDKLPYNRCLNFQARIARQYALKIRLYEGRRARFSRFLV
ncbi:hypothetical protein Ae201684P_005214 [Aphanomyces euteiches]|uniref:Uncharacterized protein n=2 Tax=Aphanomyces euteiches TaxID=100861 RepID=A0A6G0X0W2_9STRA|nr:hypothetical protein Ae201684_009749 [Aphanomyces euteiches]KAH9085508.1 hypothetical protein Ae201684P_005214 [Aphanomyces euteiches]